jgi:hypothetical protein
MVDYLNYFTEKNEILFALELKEKKKTKTERESDCHLIFPPSEKPAWNFHFLPL